MQLKILRGIGSIVSLKTSNVSRLVLPPNPCFGRFFSAHRSKPIWQIKKPSERFGPEIPDSHYYFFHPTYTTFILWLRALRPYIEKCIQETLQAVSTIVVPIRDATLRFLLRHNPTIPRQIAAFVGFYLTFQSIHMWLNRGYQMIMDKKHEAALKEAEMLETIGFWRSQKEDLQHRIELFNSEHRRLTLAWNRALKSALEQPTAQQGYTVLCDHLMAEKSSPLPQDLPYVSWLFDLIPYNSEDSVTFGVPAHEQPQRAFAFNSTSNNLFYDWGDYIDRKDNKLPILRSKRRLFTDIFIPPDK